MAEPTPKVCHFTQVPDQVFGEDAPGVTIRRLIDEEPDGAPVYTLRMIEVAPGGHTPDHSHPYEHENFVLAGKGRVRIGEAWHELGEGDVAFVPPGVQHTYVNTGDEPFRFLCGVPVPSLGRVP